MSADLCDTGRDSELEALGRLDPCGRRDYLSSRTGGLGFPPTGGPGEGSTGSHLGSEGQEGSK